MQGHFAKMNFMDIDGYADKDSNDNDVWRQPAERRLIWARPFCIAPLRNDTNFDLPQTADAQQVDVQFDGAARVLHPSFWDLSLKSCNSVSPCDGLLQELTLWLSSATTRVGCEPH